MFKAVQEKDQYGDKQTHYYLTKGDSCKIIATPEVEGVFVADEVKSCVFKLAETNFKMLSELFPINMTKNNNSFILTLDSTITSQIPAGTYLYEIEYTMNDDSVQTPHSWVFDILPEITNK